MKSIAVSLSWTFAIAFFGATILGFLPNLLLGENAYFVTKTAYNFVHLSTAIGFVIVALMGQHASIRFMQVFGILYLLIGTYGFMIFGEQDNGDLLYLIHINRLDNLLHVVLGLVIATAGWIVGAISDRNLTIPTV